MMHPSTKTLVDRLAEMTRQKKLGWEETSSGSAVSYATEGYTVHLIKSPQTLQLTDASGSILEDVPAEDIAASQSDAGTTYTQIFDDLFKEAARQARGTEKAIDAVLAGLDLEGDAAPDAAAPAQVSQQPGALLGDQSSLEDVGDETGAIDTTWASAPETSETGSAAEDTAQEFTTENGSGPVPAGPSSDSASRVGEAVATMADQVNGEGDSPAQTDAPQRRSNGILGGGTFGTGYGGFGGGYGAAATPTSTAPEVDVAPTEASREPYGEATQNARDEVIDTPEAPPMQNASGGIGTFERAESETTADGDGRDDLSGQSEAPPDRLSVGSGPMTDAPKPRSGFPATASTATDSGTSRVGSGDSRASMFGGAESIGTSEPAVEQKDRFSLGEPEPSSERPSPTATSRDQAEWPRPTAGQDLPEQNAAPPAQSWDTPARRPQSDPSAPSEPQPEARASRPFSPSYEQDPPPSQREHAPTRPSAPPERTGGLAGGSAQSLSPGLTGLGARAAPVAPAETATSAGSIFRPDPRPQAAPQSTGPLRGGIASGQPVEGVATKFGQPGGGETSQTGQVEDAAEESEDARRKPLTRFNPWS